MPSFSSTLLRLFILALSLSLAGCATGGSAGLSAPVSAADWDLTHEAQAIFLHLKAEDLLRSENPQQAVPVLKSLMETAPSLNLYMQLATLQWQSGNRGQARQTAKTGMERFPDSPQPVLFLAKTYLSEKRIDDAVLTVQDYLSTHPTAWDMHEDLGALLIDAARYPTALDTLENIPEDKRTPRGLLLLGKAAGELGLQEKAIQALKQAIATDAEFFQARVELAFLYERAKNYTEAEAIYADLLKEGQISSQLLSRLVELNLKLNNPDKAMEIASLSEPEGTELRLDMVQLFLDQGFYAHAQDLLAPVLTLPEVPARAWFQLALLAFDGQNDADRALDALAEIDDEDPLFKQALLFRIHLATVSRKYDEALYLADKGAASFPDRSQFLLMRCEVLEQAGKTEQALTELEKIAATHPNNTDILFRLGVLQDKAGQADRALEQMERIIRTDPNHADALNYLGYTLADQGRDLDRALVLIRNALRQEPDNVYFRDSLAWALFRKGHLHEAWKEITATVAAAPQDPTIWEHYGDIALALGKQDAARRGYKESLKHRPDNENVRHKLNQL